MKMIAWIKATPRSHIRNPDKISMIAVAKEAIERALNEEFRTAEVVIVEGEED
jgi:hypothetical protein